MRLIDVEHLGRERVIGAWLVDGVLVDPGPGSCLDALLAGLDGERPRVIALTHIHLDHAGATGALVRRWPEVEVWVHERGARHLASPERLMASATRLYGADMERLWGEMVPVPADRLRIVGDERRGGFLIARTPGHASHHVCLLHEASGAAFTGDTAGVRIADGPIVAPTPPPDIDLVQWPRSLDVIAGWDPDRIAVTHFGAFEDPATQLEGVHAWLNTWGPQARDLDVADFNAAYREWLGGQVDGATGASMLQAAPPEQLWAGLDRYWRTLGGAPDHN